MRRMLRFGRLFFFSPAQAAAACLEEAALISGLSIYAITLLASAVFLCWKPYDFPDANAPTPLGPQGIFFWLKLLLWQPLLMAALIGFCGALLRWLKDGWLPLKVASSVLWSAVPLILTILYVKNILPKTSFAVLLALWAAPVFLVARRIPAGEWRTLAAFLLGLNVIELAALPLQAAVTLLRWEAGYKGVVGLAGLWMLLCGALGLKALPPSRPLARALLALLFALVLQITVVIAAFMLGWLPPETLKALLYG